VLANTWGAVYRDGEDDSLGDPISAEAPVAGLERVVLSIVEKSRAIYDPETDEVRTVRYGTGRARSGTDIRRDDRIQDLKTGKWWAVREVSSGAASFAGYRDLSFDLRAS
jgi:hypothetical protein